MPRLRSPLRVPEASRPFAELPDLRQRRSSEAAVRVRRQHQRRQERRLGHQRRRRRLRDVRRSTRTRFLFNELKAPRALRALRHQNFRLFFVGQIISLTGTWMQSVAEAWLVYRLTGSSALLGVTAFASQVPIFL